MQTLSSLGRPAFGSRFRILWLVPFLLIAAASAARAGEFFIRVEAPDDWKDRRIKDAILVVRAYASGEPTSARIVATAEGIVDGRRRTVPLKVRPASAGIYAIQQEWPSHGDWIVVIHGTQQDVTCSKLVELGPDGKIPPDQKTCLCPKCYPWREGEGLRFNAEKRLPVKTAFRRFTAREIEEALTSPAADADAPRRTDR